VVDAPKIKLSKRRRRVVLVLLTDAANLSGWALARLAGAPGWSVYMLLDRLEDAGLVVGNGQFYRLTPDGWVWAWDVLGLRPPEVRRG
jgi:predicted transcriptional regulator